MTSLARPILCVLTVLLFMFCWEAGYYLSTPPLLEKGSPATIYSNQLQDDLRLLYTSAIDQAKESILVIIYALKDEKILTALRNKSDAGVEVHVICDSSTNERIERKLGGKVKLHKWSGRGIMHQKLLVIDKKQVWIGSSNMTTESLQMHGNLVIALESLEMANFIWNKAAALKETSGKKIKFSPRTFYVAGQKIDFWFAGDDKASVPQLIQLINSAEKTLQVAMFTWTRHDLAEEIIAAKKRGILTDVVIDNNSGNGVSASIVQKLYEGRVPTALSQGKGLLHHKFFVIDGKTLINGSTNWTKAAFTQNEDCFIILYEMNEQQRKKMQALWKVIKHESQMVHKR